MARIPPIGKRFEPGRSGNPGGRPKDESGIREYARSFSREAVDGLLAIARDPETSDDAKIRAWGLLLDRGLGRPRQELEVATQGTFKAYLGFDPSKLRESQGDGGTVVHI